MQQMQQVITLGDMLAIMDARHTDGSPIPFDFTRITANTREESGGMRESYLGATLCGGQFGKKESSRNANHYANCTRNVMLPGKRRPTTIGIHLITHFNGQKVII